MSRKARTRKASNELSQTIQSSQAKLAEMDALLERAEYLLNPEKFENQPLTYGQIVDLRYGTDYCDARR